MSADNWTHCPRCTDRGTKRLDARAAEIAATYGTVPVEEFDRARQDLEHQRNQFAARYEKFREDYEIYGADTGTVTVSYHGQCSDCGLKLSIREQHEIPDWRQP